MGTRSEQLASIPESISRAAYHQLIQAALPGIEFRNLRSLELGPNAIVAEVLATDADGRLIRNGDEAAMHSIVIPVQD